MFELYHKKFSLSRGVSGKNYKIFINFYWNKYYVNSQEESVARRRVIIDTYHYAVANGDKNVYFIDGESIFRGPFEDSCTVDGCHPNDLGFAFMAEAVTAVLKRVPLLGKYLV